MYSASRCRQVVGALLLQALVWVTLTGAFAVLLRLAGPQQPWANALRFSALSWIPWVVLAPAVFWFSGKFPLERGHLWRSIPAHVVGCAACVGVTLWVTSYVSFPTRPGAARFEERRIAEREGAAAPTDKATARSSPGGARIDPYTGASRPERERGERGPRDGRGGGRHGLFWWPFLGATLLRANFDAAVYLIVAVAAHALAFYRRAQERERHAIALTAGLNRAKLDALRLQLQPHFLFNTLNAISTLVHRDATAADELIGDLSELLRLSLQTSDHEVPLARELELLERYIAIEQARLGERLTVQREIDPDTTSAYVPTFLLQPLVENAIRHGIEPRRSPGRITVRAQRVGATLRLAVVDDGVGLGNTAVTARHGIGIANTEARLRALHGDAGQLEIRSPDTGGVEVTITLPYTTSARLNPT